MASQQYGPKPAPARIPYNTPQAASFNRGIFEFDGGAATYWGTAIMAFIVTVGTLGICAPWGICMMCRWRTKHTIIDGRRLRFTGGAWGLFAHWILWWLLCVLTLGIYLFWVVPRVTRWVVEHQEYAS